jgi:hypothetical protein
MKTIAWRFYLDTEPGSTVRLPKAGTRMENPYVFDASAQDIKVLAAQGCVNIVSERREGLAGDSLITDLVFTKIR